MVLYSGAVGDYDKRVVLLTREKGRIAAFARGARKQGSPLMAAVLPFCYGEFSLYAGRDYYVITEAKPARFFNGFRDDVARMCYASYFAEVMNYIARENSDASQLLLHLYVTLAELEKHRHPMPLIRSIFELRTLVLEGVFSPDSVRTQVQDGTDHALRYIAASTPGKVYAFRVSDAVQDELSRTAVYLFTSYAGHRFTSLDILDSIEPLS